jgi:hypothetical protein
MSNIRIIAFVTVVLGLTFGQPLHAGIIDWTYSSSGASASNPNIPSAFVGLGGNASNFWVEWVYFADQPTTAESGSGRFALGAITPFWKGPSSQGPPTSDINFRITLNLTDSASQMSGSVVFSGYFVPGGHWFAPYTMQYTGPSEQSLFLGDNRYDVTLPYQANGTYVDVTVAPLVPTPEPASICLVIPALGGILLFRERRFKKRRAVMQIAS